jgi:hypothetical protein
VSTTAWIFLGLGVWIGLLLGVGALCIAGARDERLARRTARARSGDGPRRCRALVADGPVPDGVDEDAKAIAREQCDGSALCAATEHVHGCYRSHVWDDPALYGIRRGRGFR